MVKAITQEEISNRNTDTKETKSSLSTDDTILYTEHTEKQYLYQYKFQKGNLIRDQQDKQ